MKKRVVTGTITITEVEKKEKRPRPGEFSREENQVSAAAVLVASNHSVSAAKEPIVDEFSAVAGR